MSSGTTKYKSSGTEYAGSYVVEGYVLTLTSPLGTLKASVGLLDAKKLAQSLLKVLVRRSEALAEPRVLEPQVIEAATVAATQRVFSLGAGAA